MNFDDTLEEAAFRATARAWLDVHAPKEHLWALGGFTLGKFKIPGFDLMAASRAWQKKKAEANWAVLHWPAEYGGRDATPVQRVIFQQEEGPYGVLSGVFNVGQSMCGPTIMGCGSEAQRKRFLKPIASGEELWCQLFSEPAAGSDLAGLRTRAMLATDGSGDWIVNGSKIWTSHAQWADFGLLLARTNPGAPKHQGLTMFLLDMTSAGVEVRPIKQANEGTTFNEVFFTDVRVPDSLRVGAIDDGWKVSLHTLMNERVSFGLKLPTGFSELFDMCQRLPLDHGLAIENPAVREQLATFAVRARGIHYTVLRAISALSRGQAPGPENSIGKLVASPMMQEVAAYALDLLDQAGIALDPTGAGDAAFFQAMLLRSPATRIEGGTDEIMRNIIAERVLGLPGDVRVDKDVAFDQIPHASRPM